MATKNGSSIIWTLPRSILLNLKFTDSHHSIRSIYTDLYAVLNRLGMHALHWLRRLCCGTPSWSLAGHTRTSWVSFCSFPSASCRGFPLSRSSRHGFSSTEPSAGASRSQESLPARRTLGSSIDQFHFPSL